MGHRGRRRAPGGMPPGARRASPQNWGIFKRRLWEDTFGTRRDRPQLKAARSEAVAALP